MVGIIDVAIVAVMQTVECACTGARHLHVPKLYLKTSSEAFKIGRRGNRTKR